MSLFRWVFIFFFISIEGFASLDLNQFRSPFVLDTKRIYLQEHPRAYNPSIIRWKNGLLMSFRISNERDKKEKTRGDKLGLVWLDDHFNPLGNSEILKIPEGMGSGAPIDGRLIQVGDTLFMVYSDRIPTADKKKSIRRMFVATVAEEEGHFFLKDFHCLKNYEGAEHQPIEKNWTPFEFEGNLLYAYTILPHKILRLNEEKEFCETCATTFGSIQWIWGELRGGSPALLIGSEYLSFFHSSAILKTVQSKNKEMFHYFMGAYTFSSQPPFEVTRISPAPIIGKSFYDSENYFIKKPSRVIFPCGYIADESSFWVVYGRQDCEIWVAKIDKKELMKSLVPVSSANVN